MLTDFVRTPIDSDQEDPRLVFGIYRRDIYIFSTPLIVCLIVRFLPDSKTKLLDPRIVDDSRYSTLAVVLLPSISSIGQSLPRLGGNLLRYPCYWCIDILMILHY